MGHINSFSLFQETCAAIIYVWSPRSIFETEKSSGYFHDKATTTIQQYFRRLAQKTVANIGLPLVRQRKVFFVRTNRSRFVASTPSWFMGDITAQRITSRWSTIFSSNDTWWRLGKRFKPNIFVEVDEGHHPVAKMTVLSHETIEQRSYLGQFDGRTFMCDRAAIKNRASSTSSSIEFTKRVTELSRAGPREAWATCKSDLYMIMSY